VLAVAVQIVPGFNILTQSKMSVVGQAEGWTVHVILTRDFCRSSL